MKCSCTVRLDSKLTTQVAPLLQGEYVQAGIAVDKYERGENRENSNMYVNQFPRLVFPEYQLCCTNSASLPTQTTSLTELFKIHTETTCIKYGPLLDLTNTLV